MANELQLKLNSDQKVVATIVSENERDMSAIIIDPHTHILTVASMAGLSVTVSGQLTSFQPQSNDEETTEAADVESTAEEVEES